MASERGTHLPQWGESRVLRVAAISVASPSAYLAGTTRTMDHFPSTETARPWWEDVAHLRGDDDHSARGAVARTADPVDDEPLVRLDIARPDRSAARSSRATHGRQRPSGRSRTRQAEAPSADWFADEASTAGRRSTPRVDSTRPQRPRVTLVDVSPDHALVRRAPQVRRAPGERPTVTITGRPDAALPPQVKGPAPRRARRTREQASSLVASPDRMILWAVALGLLMILASIGTANADAATTLTLLP